MEALEAIVTRVSPLQLKEPAPTPQEFDRIIEAATTAPDHGRLKPWRFIMIAGAARTRFGELMAASLLTREPTAGEQRLQAEREKALRAPAIVVVVATPRVEAAIPYIEQIVAVGAATQNLLLAAHALGYGTFWRTGALAYDRTVRRPWACPSESIIGFIYVGSVAVPGKPRSPQMTLPIGTWPE
jgi:nitroreductase